MNLDEFLRFVTKPFDPITVASIVVLGIFVGAAIIAPGFRGRVGFALTMGAFVGAAFFACLAVGRGLAGIAGWPGYIGLAGDWLLLMTAAYVGAKVRRA